MPMQQTQNCFICETPCTSYRFAQSSITEFECKTCGHYSLGDSLKKESDWVRPFMFYYLLHNKSDKILAFVVDKPSDFNKYEKANFITIKSLKNIRPNTLNDKVDMILLNIGTVIKFWGDRCKLAASGQADVVKIQFILNSLLLICDVVVTDSKDYQKVHGTIKILEDYGYLERVSISTGGEYTFTVNGWKRLGELKQKNDELPQAFIAMWFDKTMETARSSIIKAIEDSGYIPVIIDEKEHNNQIVPEIFYEIQRSKFIVADLTGHRNGVYYEAGYAQALEKEVIISCKNNNFKERHFDVAQINTISWTDENDLYNRLLKRIESTVGKRN